jgi:hypothetical protein|nr:MAG TPA: replisome organizer [Caudoviricetes sp.]
MDKNEFSMFSMALKTYYPRENLLPNTQAMELWFKQLQDIPYTVAETALNKWVAVNKWSPSIADIRAEAAEIKNGETPDWGEGWESVIAAIRRYGSYRVDESMASFEPVTRRCVERIGFLNICQSENIAADRANFRTLYEQLAEKEQKHRQMPKMLEQLISKIQAGEIDVDTLEARMRQIERRNTKDGKNHRELK